MAIENLPRPWVLAALTWLKVSELLALPENKRPEWRREGAVPRPEARRRRRDCWGIRCPGHVVSSPEIAAGKHDIRIGARSRQTLGCPELSGPHPARTMR